MTLIAVIGRDTGSQSGFSHIAFHLVGYGFTIRAIEHSELSDLAEVGWGDGAIDGAIGEVVFRFVGECQLVGEVGVTSEGFI